MHIKLEKLATILRQTLEMIEAGKFESCEGDLRFDVEYSAKVVEEGGMAVRVVGPRHATVKINSDLTLIGGMK